MDWSDSVKPEISVIMSVYNDEKYIAKAIDSILTQSFSNFELIICDDYSTDRSSNIIEKYVKQDNRIVFFKNEKNLGLATSLNRCIERAKGKYIARMDSDDISLPNRFEVEYNYLEDNSDIVVVGCKCQCIDENDEIYKDFQIHSGSVSFYDAIKKVQIVHPTVMMRKEALLSVDGYTVNNLTLTKCSLSCHRHLSLPLFFPRHQIRTYPASDTISGHPHAHMQSAAYP